LKYNRPYHPAFVWGYLTVFACLVIMAILALTNVIPLELQPIFIFLLVSGAVIGAGVATAGYFMSVDRQAYPLMLSVLLISTIVFVAYILTTR
jgi:hypothetical protein